MNKEYTEKIIKWVVFIFCATNLTANNQKTYTRELEALAFVQTTLSRRKKVTAG